MAVKTVATPDHSYPLILGAGSWGTALAILLARKHPEVWLWGRNVEHIARLQKARCNARFLPSVPLPDNLHVSATLDDCFARAGQVIIAVPSQGFRTLLQAIKTLLPSDTGNGICWATKGLEHGSGLLLHEVAQAVLGKTYPLAMLSGPSFALEVARELPTAVTLAATDEHYAHTLVELFHTPHFRAYTSQDMVGVQIGGAVKNVIAIAAGIVDGLALGANTRAALITRGLTEIVRLGTRMGAQAETLAGLSGLGDLVLTCTDNQSRNRRFGQALAQGGTLEQVQQQIGQIVEGVYAAQEISALAERLQVEMPIVNHVQAVLASRMTPQAAVHSLLSREPKAETDGQRLSTLGQEDYEPEFSGF